MPNLLATLLALFWLCCFELPQQAQAEEQTISQNSDQQQDENQQVEQPASKDEDRDEEKSSTPSSTPQWAPYDAELSRLYDLLGSLHYLQNCCFAKTQKWRDLAQSLALAEHLTPERRQLLISSFNTSYRTFATTYSSCTDCAKSAYNIYKSKALTLVNDILDKYYYRED